MCQPAAVCPSQPAAHALRRQVLAVAGIDHRDGVLLGAEGYVAAWRTAEPAGAAGARDQPHVTELDRVFQFVDLDGVAKHPPLSTGRP